MSRRVLAVLAGLLVTWTVAAPAHAERSVFSVRDATGDVVRTPTGGSDGCGEPCVVHDVPAADITRLRAGFRDDLTLAVRLRVLVDGVGVGWRVRAGGREHVVVVRWRLANPRVGLFVAGTKTPCRGLIGGVGPGRTVTATVPASCLGGAARVRVGALSVVRSQGYLYADDAQRTAFDASGGARRARLGPVLTRGR